ncbi:helix-turn-helix domain-containing protein [Bacillus cereus group sp. RP43]|uniref:helix-turn-helix domain-containing protein n=1 Tax=Bacillus cereus group sp. RP43 TaxID=3040260 RepID=UPI00339607CF
MSTIMVLGVNVMHKMIKSLIHDKSRNRKLQILEILITEEQVTSIELAKQVNCSDRTIIHEIRELKNSLPRNWDIISRTAKGYILHKPPTETLAPIIMSYLQESVIYKILIEIFHNKHYSLEKWSQILYINKVTLKKILKKYNTILDEFKLEFTTDFVKLKGEEINIRYFYLIFYLSIEQCMPTISLPDDLIRNIKKTLDFYEVKVDYFLLKVLVYVSIYRITGKKFTDRNIEFTNLYAPNQTNCFDIIIFEIEGYCMVKLSKNEKDALKIFIYFSSSSFSNIQQTNAVLKYYEDKNGKPYQWFLKLIDMMNSDIEGSNIEFDYLKRELFNHFLKVYIAKYYSFPIKYLFIAPTYLSHRFQELYNNNLFIISKWNETVTFNKYNEHDIRHLAQNATLILDFIYPKKNVLFMYYGNEIYERLAYITLKDVFGVSMNIYRKSDNNIKYDLIITNYRNKSFSSEIPVYFIYRNFNQKDIEHITHVLFK